MRIDVLKLYNFRNYNRLTISFHPNLNLIYGKNGSGKTNLVEAIYVLALTRSFRLVGDKTLILDTTSMCKIEGTVFNTYSTNYQILLSKEGKKVQINHDKVAKISDYVSKIPIVLFHPDDLRFIKDTPSTRRKTINISISLLDLPYLRYLNLYNKLLKQRNAYLKQMSVNGNSSSDYLTILTDKLIQYGCYIHKKRQEFLVKINSYISSFYEKITGIKGLTLKYVSSYNDLNSDEIRNLYEKSLSKDLTFGKTAIGVHMDDIKFYLNDKDLKEYGSEGQQKNAIIAYKFSEIEVFKECKGYYPILILDDLFSELDEEKVQNILSLLKTEIQTFITTTDVDKLSFLPYLSYKQIHIQNGKVVEESEHERRE